MGTREKKRNQEKKKKKSKPEKKTDSEGRTPALVFFSKDNLSEGRTPSLGCIERGKKEEQKGQVANLAQLFGHHVQEKVSLYFSCSD